MDKIINVIFMNLHAFDAILSILCIFAYHIQRNYVKILLYFSGGKYT